MAQERNVRTTPRWLQPLAVAALAALSIYELACFHYALTTKGTPMLWWGTWQMFTTLDSDTEFVEGERFYEGEWHTFDPQTLFPFEWESGPRYARGGFYDARARMQIFAESTCRRSERPIEKVRYTLVTFERTFGTMARPAKVEEKELVEWTCGSTWLRLPNGRRL